jgi:hypothetical protein
MHSALSRRRLLYGALGLLTLPVACGGASGEPAPTPRPRHGQPRSYFMGFSSVPSDTADDAYEHAFRLAAQTGEVVLVQRAPPWTDFLPGRMISSRIERLTRLEKNLAHKYGLRLFLAIDPTDPADRGRLASPPAELATADFSKPEVRDALIAYAKYLALNYHPAYLAFGVEVDMFYSQRGDAAFRNFQSLYFEAYDAVKSAAGDTLVFPTFQYENLRGDLRRSSALWGLLSRFDPKIDLLAVSSFPGVVHPDAASLPQDYYGDLQLHTKLPLALSALGWSSTPPVRTTAETGESGQDEFVRRVLMKADAIQPQLLIWYLGQDLLTPLAGFESSAAMGLIAVDGRQKPAYQAWASASKRPPPG